MTQDKILAKDALRDSIAIFRILMSVTPVLLPLLLVLKDSIAQKVQASQMSSLAPSESMELHQVLL